MNEALKKYKDLLIQKRYGDNTQKQRKFILNVSKRTIDKIKNPIDDFFE
jgi:hypothetical protein